MNREETATKIAEAIMDAIENRRGILKDDLVDAARKVLATQTTQPPQDVTRDALWWHHYVLTDNTVKGWKK